jgi:hypothetical protein
MASGVSRRATIKAIAIRVRAPTHGEGEGIAPIVHPLGAVAGGGATHVPVDVQT